MTLAFGSVGLVLFRDVCAARCAIYRSRSARETDGLMIVLPFSYVCTRSHEFLCKTLAAAYPSAVTRSEDRSRTFCRGCRAIRDFE